MTEFARFLILVVALAVYLILCAGFVVAVAGGLS